MNKHAKHELLRVYYRNYGLNLSFNEIEKLQKTAIKLQRAAVHLCNGTWDQEKFDRNDERCFLTLKSIFVTQGISPTQIETGGDPRGACLKIHVPSKHVIIAPIDFEDFR